MMCTTWGDARTANPVQTTGFFGVKKGFRRDAVQRCHRGGGRREGMRQGAPEDPRPFPEAGGGEGDRPPIRRGSGAQAVQAGEKTLRGTVRSVLRRLGGAADMKEERPPAINPILRMLSTIG